MHVLALVLLIAGCTKDDDDSVETDDTADADTDTDTDTDSDTDTDTDSDTDTDTGEVVTLRNHVATCGNLGRLQPASSEDGHLAAARLTPASYPFELAEVRVDVAHDATLGCEAGGSFTLEVYVADAVAPPATPTVIETFALGPVTISGVATRTLVGHLTTPVTVTQDQDIFVAVKNDFLATGTPPVTTCIKTCLNSGVADRNYWSNAAAPPYAWVTLASFNINGNIWAEADSTP